MEPTRNRFGMLMAAQEERRDQADGEGAPAPSPIRETLISRRAAIGGGLAGLAGLGGVLLFPTQLMAKSAVQSNTFTILVNGVTEPVVNGPDLGLSTVDLKDGSYSTTKLYPVSGTPGGQDPNKSIGDFYVQFAGDLCAYHIPGGSFSMRFLPGPDNGHAEDDGHGGVILVGTAELTILEGTGTYRRLAGGHNHMVDRLHVLPPGDGSGGYEDYCFCIISEP